tara:strand:- start:24 stop:1298 length:1275 start_codon:yes stop_codon:yes gene_type:complete
MPKFQESRLANGLRILSEYHPKSAAVCMSFSVHVGSKDEPEELNGISHLIEHMVFKGTKKRSAYQISEEIELLGGDINAYTGREITCFYTSLLSEDYQQGVDILSDIVFRSKMKNADLEKEKQVVSHEIAMTEDLYEEQIFDDFYEYIYPGQSHGKPILGTPQSLKNIDRRKIMKFMRDYYQPENMVFVSCGGVPHDKVVKAVKKYMQGLEKRKAKTLNRLTVPDYKIVKKNVRKNSEQAHVLLGFPLSSYQDGTKYEVSILNTYLGSGAISLLFQDLREEKGLCYSVYSMFAPMETSGMMLIYLGTEKGKIAECLEIIRYRLQQIKSESVPEKSMNDIKKLWIKSLKLQDNDMDARMNQILQDAFLKRPYRSFQQIKKGIESVSVESMQNYIDEYFNIEQTSLFMFSDLNKKQFQNILKRYYA